MTSTSVFVSKEGRPFVDSGSYGSPPKSLPSNEASMRVRFYNFADLPHMAGLYVESTTMEALDHKWKLRIYPGGHRIEDIVDVSCFLLSVDVEEGSKKEVKAKCMIDVGDGGEVLMLLGPTEITITPKKNPMGRTGLASRRTVLSNLLDDEGTFIIDVHLQMNLPSVWRPKPSGLNPFGHKMLESSVGTDISFVVGTEEEKFQAHKIVLSVQAPGLYEFVQDIPQGEDVPIQDITSSTFKILLEHIYTGILPQNDDGSSVTKELLLGADRFSLTKLKLHVESAVVSKLLNSSNAAEWLLIADGHSCPLLKESCMDLYTNKQAEVMASSGWSQVKESLKLVVELLEYPVAAKARTPKGSKDFDNMPVRMLLEKLEDSGLDLDGTREILIQRLKEHHHGGN